MFSPKDDATRERMLQAHKEASQRLGVTCAGPAAWGWEGRTIGRRAGDRWLRLDAAPQGRAEPDPSAGLRGATDRVSDDVPRPLLFAASTWTADGFTYAAELATYVTAPVVCPHRPDLDHDPGLPDEWWAALRTALDSLASATPPRVTIRDQWIERAFPQFLGIPGPGTVERATGHADLHWANLTAAPLTLLDWERWGSVPVGYDPGLLHANSLLVPDVAARLRTEFAHILDTPAGRIGELVALAEMLQAVARGWYPELAPLLAARAAQLTGVPAPAAPGPVLSRDGQAKS